MPSRMLRSWRIGCIGVDGQDQGHPILNSFISIRYHIAPIRAWQFMWLQWDLTGWRVVPLSSALWSCATGTRWRTPRRRTPRPLELGQGHQLKFLRPKDEPPAFNWNYVRFKGDVPLCHRAKRSAGQTETKWRTHNVKFLLSKQTSFDVTARQLGVIRRSCGRNRRRCRNIFTIARLVRKMGFSPKGFFGTETFRLRVH